MKLWNKNIKLKKEVELFTVGNDHILDYKLLKYDCIASIAHAKMLHSINLITKNELNNLIKQLNNIIKLNKLNKFKINIEDEDCHTAIENYLTTKLGLVGKKIHTARSRNDQVLTALRLYEKDELKQIEKLVKQFINSLKLIKNKYKNISLAGYTHMQKAMPMSVNMWLGCYEEAMIDNLKIIKFISNLINQNPLGSGAGFGIPVFKVNKKLTTKELNFSKIMNNPMYCQHSRGKFESQILNLLVLIMFDLNKLASDLMLFTTNKFNYVTISQEFCTGSSIMPQKKNPDLLELIRGKYHVILGEEFKLKSLISNLISGYNRDIQLTKEPLINSIEIVKETMKVFTLLLSNITINKESCKNSLTEELYATKQAYELVEKGTPFREAYKQIGLKYLNK